MSHQHAHGHSHNLDHGSARLRAALILTSIVLVAELVGAALTRSLALLIDAAHMLTDVAGLAMALCAAYLSSRPPTNRRTWGLRRAEVISALLQAILLCAVGLFVVAESVNRLLHPSTVAASEMLWFGILGLVCNLIAIAILASRRGHSLNLRAAFLEVVNDALGSVAVIVAAIVIALTGYAAADSIAALLIGALIVPRAVRLIRETVDVLLESTPAGLDLDAVRGHLLEVPHVRSVHDLHASLIATGLPVLTAHIVVDDECFDDGHARQQLADLKQCVATHFEVPIAHATFQLEPRSLCGPTPGACIGGAEHVAAER
ncbi:cation transporter [Micrococcales bacterium 31B]|nr:cation transporter [Micrococcales bacterium 31B]